MRALKIKIYLFVFILFSFIQGHGQMPSVEELKIKKLPFEEIELFTDRDIYLSGEKIWFAANCIIPGYENQQMSNILYVELYNASIKSIVQKKFSLTDGRANGTIEIPPEFLSGNYFLRAYTNYLKNFPVGSYITKVITIINPLLPLPAQSKNIQNKAESFTDKPGNDKDGIELKTNKQSYSTRDVVELYIMPGNLSNGESIDLTVSVVKKGTLYEASGIFMSNLSDKFNKGDSIPGISSEEPSALEYLPEIRDVSINGIAVDEYTAVPLSDVLVYLCVGNAYPQIHIYRTGEDGKFVFSLNNFEGDQEVFLCPLKWEKSDEPEIKVFSDFLPEFPAVEEIPLMIDTNQLELLEEMLINMQVSKAFDTEQGNDSVIQSHIPYPFADPPISVVLDDYIESPSLEVVFRELVPRVRLRKKDGIYSLSVFDFNNEVYYDDPLILIDNIPVFDINELLKIPPDYIEKIEVHNSPVILGDNILKGIIMLTTTTDDFGGMVMPPASSFLKYETLAPVHRFDPSQYSNQEKKDDPRADFRTLLYWAPNVKVKSDTTISFYTSDHRSEYEVIVRGRTAGGKQVFGRTRIFVGK